MSGKKKEEVKAQERDTEVWMDTLADLVFLMITFFVLLISMSSMDSKKIKAAFGFFDEADGVLMFPSDANGARDFIATLSPISKFNKDPDEALDDLDDRRDAAKELLDGIADGLVNNTNSNKLMETLKPLANDAGAEFKIIRLADGVEVVITGRLLFSGVETKIDPEGKRLLASVATVLKLWGGETRIIAMWSWSDGPGALATVIDNLQKNGVRGGVIYPQIYPSIEKKIRFIMRKGNE